MTSSVMSIKMNGILFLTGLSLALAYDDLSYKKVVSQSKTSIGPLDLYKADNAVDRKITTCMRTEAIGGASPDKTVWWKVDLGGVYNIYSINILFKNYDGYEKRQQGRFAGFSIYISINGTLDKASLCYKDGPQLPPLNFTTICNTSGRYLTFYNERLNEVTYPEGYESYVYVELCEVIVYGCYKSGVYGSNCTVTCPINCKYNICHIQNGHCFECQPGWTGDFCDTRCTRGWYGQYCKHRCGNCRANAICDHVTGHCDAGCDLGWKEDILCNTECKNGTFGIDCLYNCSGQCLNDNFCNKQSGHCDKGCIPGYANVFCNKSCLHFYGEDCQYPCSTHCFNKTCDRSTGRCSYGCEVGFGGEKCEQDIFNELRSDQRYIPWTYGGPVLIGVSGILITVALICLCAVCTKRISISLTKPSRVKPYVYVEAGVTAEEENKHYEDITLSERWNTYFNTTLQ